MVTVFYWACGIVFVLYVIGLVKFTYDNYYAGRDIELIATKKRHPAGKRRG
jgi:hypothetical protein